jgi:2-polyprenyl-3-methyl-5-hydroxy-6-metoxy-1,4-benzoquinol methylase
MSRLTRFLRRHGYLRAAPPSAAVGRHLLAPPLGIEVDVGQPALSSLFDRVASAWTELGATEPHWSVLTHDIYRKQEIGRTRGQFFETADWDVGVIEACFGRPGLALPSGGKCLELGCGVGRVTSRLATMFQRVVAVDISQPHLALAAERVRTLGLSNVDLVRLTRVEDLCSLPRYDFLYSRIVLQHNPPPVIAYILRSVLDRLSPGGFCLFQLPTYCDGYRFVLADYLAEPRGGMEMHVLPQPVVFAILREAGIDLIEAVEDQSTDSGIFQSMTFFGRKSAEAATTGLAP